MVVTIMDTIIRFLCTGWNDSVSQYSGLILVLYADLHTGSKLKHNSATIPS